MKRIFSARQWLPLLLTFTLLLSACALPAGVQVEVVQDADGNAANAEPATTLPQPATSDEYVDPDGRFSVPIPTSWTSEQREGYALLSDPDAQIALYFLTVEAESAEAAIEAGWQTVNPAFDATVDETADPPAQGGVEEVFFIQYEFDEEAERIYQAVAQRYDDLYYLLLVDADLSTAQRRAAQINIINSGWTISALEQTDLATIQALPVDEAIIGEMETFIERELELFGIPGAAVAIVQGGEIVYQNGFGVTEAGGDQPITPQTQMMIGSTGKSLTTLLMGTLVDDGLMTWDTPAVEILPQFAVADDELTEIITVRNLVCACTGVPRRDLELFFNAEELSAENVVESLRTFQFFTDFGEAFQYSNQMVATGGYVAAAAAGAEFGDLMDGYAGALSERVLEPVGMANTTLSFDEVTARGDYAQPHALTFGTVYEPISLTLETLLTPVAPAGAHWSTLEDMTNYLIMELNAGVAVSGERVVSEANLRTTWEPQVPVGADSDYGLGWFVQDYNGLTLIEHGGNTLGFTSDFAFVPEANLGIVVLTNGQATNAFSAAVRARLLELLFEQEPEAQASLQFAREQLGEALERPEGLQTSVDPGAVEPFLGSYANADLGQVTLALHDGELIFDAGELVSTMLPLEEEGELQGYMMMEPPLTGAVFELEEIDGVQTISVGQGAVAYTFERVDE